LPREPSQSRSETDKRVDSIIRDACVDLFRHIDDSPDDRTLPPSRSDLWVSQYQQDLCAMIRQRILRSQIDTAFTADRHLIVLDREILRVWLSVRKNPEAHGVPKRD